MFAIDGYQTNTGYDAGRVNMERAIPILPAEDLAAAKDFYAGGLGFEVTFEASADGRSGLVGLRRGTIELTIDSPMDGHGRGACVSLRVDDADAYYREWSAKVDILRPPRDEGWGARTFDLLDPSGNTIFVIGPIPDAAPDPAHRQVVDDALRASG
jgi:catechol 2,3-dioxygenase-like lactoylglutathione lyase family enzyme